MFDSVCFIKDRIYCLSYIAPCYRYATLVMCTLFYVLSSFAIILIRKRELVALLLLSLGCLVTVNVLRLFLTVLWVGLRFVISYSLLLGYGLTLLAL